MRQPEELPFPFPPQGGALTRFPESPPWDIPIFQMSDWWLTVRCPKCGEAHLPLRLLAARRGWRLTLRAVVPRLKCKRCDARPASVDLVDTPQGDHGRFGAKAQRLRLA